MCVRLCLYTHSSWQDLPCTLRSYHPGQTQSTFTTMSERCHNNQCPLISTSATIKNLRISSSLPYLAIGRSLPSLIPADRRRIKRTDEEKQNKHNGDNVFLLLLVSPSDKCWAQCGVMTRLSSPVLLVKRFRGGTRWESVFLPGLFSVTHHRLSCCSALGDV